jgi:NAD(P)-dependent dehydrogenase (short-subunit alcohol dehydrogenase family)
LRQFSDVTTGGSLSDRIVVITGASDGIGAAAARILKKRGDQVVIVGRSKEKTQRVAKELGAPFYLADFSNFDDVRKLAQHLQSDLPRIDVLANNAGGVMGGRLLTIDRFELTLQVNHLAPFLLTTLLLDALIASKATVIATSSLANRRAGKLDPDDLTLAHGYSAQDAYCKAKLMNILFSQELNRRYHALGLAVASYQPGVVRTNFSSEFGGSFAVFYTSFLKYVLRSPDKGAETLVWLATTTPDHDWQPGEYFKDKKICRANRQAHDPVLAAQLWDASLAAVAIK